MRVISGSLKGRRLKSPPGLSTRPTSDKVKEAIFNMVSTEVYVQGNGLDLFAGSGSLGIEALSRGCRSMVFIDHHPAAIQAIKSNLESLNLLAQSEVYRNDARRSLKILARRKYRFDIIFIDPPYHYPGLAQLISRIDQLGLLSPQGVMVVETSKETVLDDRELSSMAVDKQQQYGDTQIIIFVGRGSAL